MLLIYFDPQKTPVVKVDPSRKGLGTSLIQKGKPIAFAFKSLTEIDQHYLSSGSRT